MDILGILTMGFLKSGGGYSNPLITTCGFLSILESTEIGGASGGPYFMRMGLALT